MEALEEISGEVGVRRDNASSSPGRKFLLPELCIRADRELWTGKGKEYVTLEESTGRISSSAVIPYPPGIPFISEGEIISQEVVTMLSEPICKRLLKAIDISLSISMTTRAPRLPKEER